MGLGLSIWYPVGMGKKRKVLYEQFFQELPSIIPEWKPDWFSADDGFRVSLVPFEESVYGEWKDGNLLVSAKTNSAGPGYHAWLVKLLDEIKVKPLKVEDETGYYFHRDFSILQKSMLDWLKELSVQLLGLTKEGAYKNLAVSIPFDRIPDQSSHFTCCPLGYFEKDFFQRASEGAAEGSEFFIWWNKEADALFFKNCALNLIWCENNWLPPVTEQEKAILRATLACLEKGYALDSSLTFPVAEWHELAKLSGDEKLTQKLNGRFESVEALSLGYLHDSISSNVGGWRLTHSGKMHFERDDNGNAVWWNDSLTIRLTTIAVQFNKEVENKSEALLQSYLQNSHGYRPFSLRKPDIHAAIMNSQVEENGKPLWQTLLVAALDNELLVLSIYYEDHSLEKLAMDICASVSK